MKFLPPKKRLADKRADDERDDWMIAVEAFVTNTNDPEGMHRIKVVIPSMDEDYIHDEWVTALVPWVGKSGYGPVGLPTLGSEVLLFGRLGQKHSLFYLCRFNEDFLIPAGFVDYNARGLKTDGQYKLLADLMISIISQTKALVQGASAVDIEAPDVRLMSGGAVSVRGQGAKVGFLGAEPVARQSLPAPATDLASCIALTNAIRALLINFGLGQ